jgi:hypothetical protein
MTVSWSIRNEQFSLVIFRELRSTIVATWIYGAVGVAVGATGTGAAQGRISTLAP